MLSRYSKIIALILLIPITRCGREDITAPIDTGLPPAIPTGLIVDGAFDGQIGISWQPNDEADISGYNVYRSTGKSSDFQLIQFTSNTYFNDLELEYDSTYTYKVSAVNRSKRESGLSAAVSATPKNIYTPLKPNIVNINARNQDGIKSVFLSWSPSIDNDIAYYEVHRDTSQFEVIDSSKLIAKVDGTFYSDSYDLVFFQNYFYRIIAVDKGNLKSKATAAVVDYILDAPVLISPANGSEIQDLSGFKIKTVSKSVNYKMIIQNSPAGDVIKNIGFSSTEPAKEIFIDTGSLQLEPYKTYFWRVLTYTNNNSEPNSYSELFSFYYNPQ